MMSESDKKSTDSPVTIISSSEVMTSADKTAKSRKTKKYVIIGVSAIATVAIILIAILVGMYLFNQAQKEIIKFAFNRDDNTKEDVTSDPNTNIVQFHASNPSYEAWIIDDFNRDIQVMKIRSEAKGTSCFVAPLNRTIATDPSKISAPSDPSSMDKNTTYSLTYQSAASTIPDTSFLCKAARDACKGISTYWVYPSCSGSSDADGPQRVKRLVCFWRIRLWIFRIYVCV